MILKYVLFCCLILYTIPITESAICNEAVCASVVSKCMLTQSCKCDLTHPCVCCKDCYTCLDYLYDQCCSCVDMCPGVYSLSNTLLTNSYTENFRDGGVPVLFASLTSAPDEKHRWIPMTISVSVSDTSLQSVDDDVSNENSLAANCTVAYMIHCMSLTKCKNRCDSMGSSGFRWFHDGCCECVGENCKNHGLDDNKCSQCRDKHEEDIDDGNMDYGDETDPLDSE